MSRRDKDNPVHPGLGERPDKTKVIDPGDHTLHLVEVLDRYLEELEAGRQPEREKVVADHPELAPQLEQALAGIEFIHQAARKPAETPALLGDFRILREVGRGGMGVVYEAEQISLKRRVALKVLRLGVVADEVAMQRFQREAETVATLHHTNIVPIFAIGAEGDVRYYAMQFIEGQDLAGLAQAARERTRTLEARDIGHWGLQAAEALAHAHQRGVIHRDIKPSNLILDQDGRIWLTDFGLARRLDDVTLSVAGVLLGTPRYMSPEQAGATAQPVDHRTDIYSLGATLYELAAGRPIFEAATPHEVLASILRDEPRPPRQFNPQLPRDLETIILKCLAKERARRYADARALAEDLRAFVDGRPIQARRPSLPERAARWARKHRRSTVVAAVSAGVSLALVLGGWLGWRFHQQSRLGQLTLTTSGPNLQAEVLNEEGRTVLGPLNVPTSEPVALPSGPYRLRLSSSGLLSQTWPLDISRGQTLHQEVRLNPHWLWPPLSLDGREYPETEIARLDSHADFLVLTHQTVDRTGSRIERRLRRLDGATGQPVWAGDFIFDASTLPPDRDLREWKELLAPSAVLPWPQVSRLMQPASDLNGDGVGDLVWFSRSSPSLLAISGADGRVLWSFRGRGTFSSSTDVGAAKLQSADGGFVVGLPLQADADGDGHPDYIACFHSRGETYGGPGGKQIRIRSQSWLGAVSGKTGLELWRVPLGNRWGDYGLSSTPAERFEALCRPALATVQGRKVVVLTDTNRLTGWDLRTGQEAWPPVTLDFEPKTAPDLVDLNADGPNEVVFSRPRPEDPTALALEAVSLPAGTVLWRTTFHPVYRFHENILERTGHRFYLLADLDGDGRLEIVVPEGQQSGLDGQERRIRLRCLDGATGRVRWEEPVWIERHYSQEQPIDQMVEGPDLDGDGQREIFLVWTGDNTGRGGVGLMAAALSGENGKTLWRTSLGPATEPGPLQWWRTGSGGRHRLLIPARGGLSRQAVTYVIESDQGTMTGMLSDVADPRVDDFNGDGIDDLTYTVSPQGVPRRMVVQGLPPETWRCLGAWRAAQDFDGDGDTDLINFQGPTPVARSGRDGRILWRGMREVGSREFFLAPLPPGNDFNGDTIPDLIVSGKVSEKLEPDLRGKMESIVALSGRDGAEIWNGGNFELYATSSGTIRSWAYHYPCLGPEDLDGDGLTEILVALAGSGDSGMTLSALSGRTGASLWRLPLVRGGYGVQPSIHPHPSADLDGDGVRDPVLWTPSAGGRSGDGPCRLQAFSGRDGSPLWTATALNGVKVEHLIWPQALSGDLDGDGWPEVFVTFHHGWNPQKNGYDCELMALDGRTGQPRWSFGWRAGFPDVWPPLILRAGAGGTGRLALGVKEIETASLVILDEAGNVAQKRPVSTGRHTFGSGNTMWRGEDLDGDGEAELLYSNDGQLCAADAVSLALRWQWPWPGEAATIVTIQPPAQGSPATVALWSGESVYGLNGLNGDCQWRGPVAEPPHWGMSNPPQISLMTAAASAGRPRLHLDRLNNSGPDWQSTCQETWPTFPNGKYKMPSPGPAKVGTKAEPASPGRPLSRAPDQGVSNEMLTGALTLFWLGIPGWLLYRMARRRSRLDRE
jgi:serine/threonine protein kinase/outer membrane protein assembly factor BamB